MTTCKRTHRMCWGRACSRLTLALTSMASASRRRRTHPSCPLYVAYSRAVIPFCGKCSTRGVIECQSTRGAWASTRGCGARHATRTRVPSSAGRRGGGAASAAARCTASSGENGAVSGERGGESSRGGEDAGAHARHMRRRTKSGLCQLTFPPRPISRVSSASSPSHAASYTALPIESLIASAALYRPSPARTPAHSGGGTRGSAVTLGRRRRALRRGAARAARPHAPRSSGGRGSRGARARRGRSQRPRRAVEAAATPGSRGPEQRGVGVRSSGRSRPSGSTRALGNARPHEGIAELTSTFGIDFIHVPELVPSTFGGPHL